MGEPPLSVDSLRNVLRRMAERRPDPAAGSAAAVAAAMAAALLAKTAGLSGGYTDDADRLVEQAEHLRGRALDLAEADARAVAAMVHRPRASDDAVAVPGRIGALAGEVLVLAEHVAEHANPRLRADVEAARHLARAAQRTAAAIAHANEETRPR
jgi:formiminotetrahydrofolate cyclodeaminase